MDLTFLGPTEVEIFNDIAVVVHVIFSFALTFKVWPRAAPWWWWWWWRRWWIVFGMVDQRKTFRFISRWDHCQRSSASPISDTPRAGFEPAQNLSSSFVEWSCAVVITTTPQHSFYKTSFLLVILPLLLVIILSKRHFFKNQF